MQRRHFRQEMTEPLWVPRVVADIACAFSLEVGFWTSVGETARTRRQASEVGSRYRFHGMTSPWLAEIMLVTQAFTRRYFFPGQESRSPEWMILAYVERGFCDGICIPKKRRISSPRVINVTVHIRASMRMPLQTLKRHVKQEIL